MRVHQWLVNVSSLLLTIAFSSTLTLAQMSTLLAESSQRSSVRFSTVTQSINQSGAVRSVFADRDADAYKLVFPTGPDTDEFGEQLKKAGERGYKLLSVMYR